MPNSQRHGVAQARQSRRYIFRDELVDLETAEKAGTRVHAAWVRMTEAAPGISMFVVVLAVAYYQDMHQARGGKVPTVYPEDIGDCTGYGSNLAGKYAQDASKVGYLVGSTAAGWSIPPDWYTG